MTGKNYTEVTIGGKSYTLGGYEEEEYLQRVATYINGKMNELRKTQGFLRQTADFRAVMLQLNIANDYFKAQSKAAALEARVEMLEKEVYDLKYELASNQINYEKK